MNFADVKSITIPEGAVKKIAVGGSVLWEKVTGRIPSEYQEVEYISAANNVGAYIDLGFAFDTKALIYLTQYISDTSVTAYPFGAAENSGALRCLLSSPYNGKSYFYGSDGTSYISCSTTISLNSYNNFKMTIEKEKLHVANLTNGASPHTQHSQTDYTMTNNLYLFAQNYNGSPRYGGVRTISEFKYYDKNDALICDLVPCCRKADGTIGMYDTVRKLFLTNVGNGTFTKGADV